MSFMCLLVFMHKVFHQRVLIMSKNLNWHLFSRMYSWASIKWSPTKQLPSSKQPVIKSWNNFQKEWEFATFWSSQQELSHCFHLYKAAVQRLTDLVRLYFKNMIKENTVRYRRWWPIVDQSCCSHHMLVSKWTDVSTKDYANLWRTSIERPISIKRPFAVALRVAV